MKHYITKYKENGKIYAEAWDQLNLLGRAFIFNRRTKLIGSARERGEAQTVNDDAVLRNTMF